MLQSVALLPTPGRGVTAAMVGLGSRLFASGLTPAISRLSKPDARPLPCLLRMNSTPAASKALLNLPYCLCRASNARGRFEPLNARNTNRGHVRKLAWLETKSPRAALICAARYMSGFKFRTELLFLALYVDLKGC